MHDELRDRIIWMLERPNWRINVNDTHTISGPKYTIIPNPPALVTAALDASVPSAEIYEKYRCATPTEAMMTLRRKVAEDIIKEFDDYYLYMQSRDPNRLTRR